MSQPTDVHTLAGAFALDAVTDIERAGFHRHLAQCESCVQEVAELTETASRLGGADWATPPPRLRDAVLAEVARTRQVSGARGASPRADDAVRRWRRFAAAAVAAAVVGVAGIGAVWVVQEGRVGDATQQAEQLREERARINAVLAADDVVVRSGRVSGGGTVTVALSPARDDGVVMLDDLATPPEGKVYQLWLITGGSAASAGVLAAGQHEGTAPLDRVSGADTLGVTLEPTGGSDRPTLPGVAGVALT
jgi:anti-sigma-K factor RskA